VDTRIQGQLDISLNETGHWQAARAAKAMTGESVHAIYFSRTQTNSSAQGRTIPAEVMTAWCE
jgi:broad specificity phosphatase PhoE